jgi:hypothetical protein
MPKRKRIGCSREGCDAWAVKAGKCTAHYMADYRAGVRAAETDDLGESPVRLEFLATREQAGLFRQSVPPRARGQVLRRALASELQRLSEE